MKYTCAFLDAQPLSLLIVIGLTNVVEQFESYLITNKVGMEVQMLLNGLHSIYQLGLVGRG